jgi:hypothetical protein
MGGQVLVGFHEGNINFPPTYKHVFLNFPLPLSSPLYSVSLRSSLLPPFFHPFFFASSLPFFSSSSLLLVLPPLIQNRYDLGTNNYDTSDKRVFFLFTWAPPEI